MRSKTRFSGIVQEYDSVTKKWTAINSVEVQAEKLVLMYPRIGMSMDSILRYEAFGIASGAYSSMKNIVLVARLKVRRGSRC